MNASGTSTSVLRVRMVFQMDGRNSKSEILRRLRALDAKLRPLGIKIETSASMIRPSRRAALAEKLFVLYAEHNIPEAFELFFEVGGEVIFELLRPLVDGGDLTDWVTSVCFEFYKGRVDLTSGFEAGIRSAVVVLKQERIEALLQSLAVEFEGLDPDDSGRLHAACQSYLSAASWRVIEILNAHFVERLGSMALIEHLEVDSEEFEQVFASAKNGIEARLRRSSSSSAESGERADENHLCSSMQVAEHIYRLAVSKFSARVLVDPTLIMTEEGGDPNRDGIALGRVLDSAIKSGSLNPMTHASLARGVDEVIALDTESLLDLCIEIFPDFHRARLKRCALELAKKRPVPEVLESHWDRVMSAELGEFTAKVLHQRAKWVGERRNGDLDRAIAFARESESTYPYPPAAFTAWLYSFIVGNDVGIENLYRAIEKCPNRFMIENLVLKIPRVLELAHNDLFLSSSSFGRARDRMAPLVKFFAN